MRAVAGTLRQEPVIFDVWNEPDIPGFWNGGRRRFFRLYALSERILRDELGPGVVVGGPSISRYSLGWLRSFLTFCKRAGCRPDFVSWHELLPEEMTISSVTDHLREARLALQGPRELHVNEHTGPVDQYRPGEAVAYFAALEEGGADYAARACWPYRGGSNCDPGRLDGLVDLAGEPRAVWWAYRWYALGAGSRVHAISNDRRISVLASGGQDSLVLVGRSERGPVLEGLDVDVDLAGLPNPGDEVSVKVERLPDSGEKALPRPLLISRDELELQDGSIRVRIPDLRPHEAALVAVR